MAENGSSQQYREKVMDALRDKSTLISLGIFVVFLIIAGILILTNQKKISVSELDEDRRNQITGVLTPSPSQPGTPSTAPITGDTYTVQDNETLWNIAERKYGSGYNWVDIVQANNIQNPDDVPAGTVLKMPAVAARKPEEAGQITADAASTTMPTGSPPATAMTDVMPAAGTQPKVTEVTVQPNDTLWSIAVQVYGSGYAWSKIAAANNIANPDVIYTGTRLTMPTL